MRAPTKTDYTISYLMVAWFAGLVISLPLFSAREFFTSADHDIVASVFNSVWPAMIWPVLAAEFFIAHPTLVEAGSRAVR